MPPTILLTFDVEDWFQVENFKQYIPFSCWPNCELRVEKNVHRILDLLDSIKLNNPTNLKNVSREVPAYCRQASRKGLTHNSKPATRNNGFGPPPPASRLAPNGKDSLCAMPAHRKVPVGGPSAPCGTLRATFFVLGWIAERLPHLVLEIQARGHEIASHGYGHELCRKQSVHELRVDLEKSKKLLEDITGNPVYAYRAPSFSIDHEILELIEGAGYYYDSSFNSFKLNRRYGQLEVGANNGSNGISVQVSDRFYELPISNLRIGKQALPWGGGGYFRLLPLSIFYHGVQSILKKQGVYLFYMHPWEVDPEQPKVEEAQLFYRLRHYTNLNNTLFKLASFIKTFKNCFFYTCHQHLKSQEVWINNPIRSL